MGTYIRSPSFLAASHTHTHIQHPLTLSVMLVRALNPPVTPKAWSLLSANPSSYKGEEVAWTHSQGTEGAHTGDSLWLPCPGPRECYT